MDDASSRSRHAWRLWRSLDEVPADWVGGAVTVGVFDGVHRGHQHVVDRTVARGQALGLPAVAVTFDPRPVDLFAGDKAPPMLGTLDTRVCLLGEQGVDAVLVLPFTREFSQLEPEAFIQAALVDRLRARAVVVGADFRFGHRAAGDVTLLRDVADSLGFAVETVSPVGEHGVTYSSSAVREHIAAGEVVAAAEILGRPHRIEGTVLRGDGRGRELGFPTANIACPAGIAVPPDGVYAGWLSAPADGQRLPVAISVGTNPTFDGDTRQVEAYVLGRGDLELYDSFVAVEFTAWLRDMRRFDSVDELVDEMRRDVARASVELGNSRHEG